VRRLAAAEAAFRITPRSAKSAPAESAARRPLLLFGIGRGDEHLVDPNDWARQPEARHVDLPGNVLVLAPLGWQTLLVGDGRAIRPAKLRPVGRERNRGDCEKDEGYPAHDMSPQRLHRG